MQDAVRTPSSRHWGPRRLDTPRGRRRVLLRDGSKWGPGPGTVLAVLGSLRRAFLGAGSSWGHARVCPSLSGEREVLPLDSPGVGPATPAPDTELPSCWRDRIAPRPSEVLTEAPVGRGTDRGLHTSLRGPDVRLGAGRGPAGWPRGGHHGPGNHLALGDPARPHAHEASMPRGSWGSPTLCFSHTLTI